MGSPRCGVDLHSGNSPLSDPTAQADAIAERVRVWYETNRESWWTRLWSRAARRGIVADNFMLELVAEVRRIVKDEKS